MVVERLSVSELRACRVLDQDRSTQKYSPKIFLYDYAMKKWVIELATDYGRSGYRSITELLRREGWRVNHKSAERIWREEGLKVPSRQPKRRRLWLNEGYCISLRPIHSDHVWSYDYVEDRTHDGRKLKMLTMIDEYTRECLTIDAERRIRSDDVINRIEQLFVRRGMHDHIRSDNGSEFALEADRG